MPRFSTVFLAASLALAPALARGDEEQPPRRWYGWQIMIADGAVAGLTLGLATVGTDTGGAGVALGILAASAFALVPPAIHLAHGSSRDALLSFAVRTARRVVRSPPAKPIAVIRRCTTSARTRPPERARRG